jgi:hypothetical protein
MTGKPIRPYGKDPSKYKVGNSVWVLIDDKPQKKKSKK